MQVIILVMPQYIKFSQTHQANRTEEALLYFSAYRSAKVLDRSFLHLMGCSPASLPIADRAFAAHSPRFASRGNVILCLLPTKIYNTYLGLLLISWVLGWLCVQAFKKLNIHQANRRPFLLPTSTPPNPCYHQVSFKIQTNRVIPIRII